MSQKGSVSRHILRQLYTQLLYKPGEWLNKCILYLTVKRGKNDRCVSKSRLLANPEKMRLWIVRREFETGRTIDLSIVSYRQHSRIGKPQKWGGYCWSTPKYWNWCAQHALFEGKKAEQTSPRKSTSRTLKGVDQQYPGVFGSVRPLILNVLLEVGLLDFARR